MVSTMSAGPLFLSCDWGTSRLRLRLVHGARHRIVAVYTAPQGLQPIAHAHPGVHARRVACTRALQRGLSALGVSSTPKIPLVISGMASSTLGWHPLPYARLPVPIDGRRLIRADIRLAGRPVRIISGLCTGTDVMRGEETELVGLFSSPSRRHWAEGCLVILPGTHSKHVRLARGRILDFTTHPTGELFELLSRHSTLAGAKSGRFSRRCFLEGVQCGRNRPLGPALFQTRARSVLGVLPARHGRAYLSGVLIGAELAALPEACSRLVLSGQGALTALYAAALRVVRPRAIVERLPASESTRTIVAGQAALLALP